MIARPTGVKNMDRTSNGMLQHIEKELRIAGPDPWVTYDHDGTMLDIIEASISMTGRTRDELIKTSLADCFTDPNTARKSLMQVFETCEVRDFELVMRGTAIYHRNHR